MNLILNENELMLYESRILDIFKIFLDCHNMKIEDFINNNLSIEKKDNYWLIHENFKNIDYNVACFSNILDVLADLLRRSIEGYKKYISLKDEFLSIILYNLEILELTEEEKESLTIKRYIKHF